MKRIAFAVAILAAVACSAQEEAEIIDTQVDPAAAPAPDEMMDMPMDTTVVDSIVPPAEETPEG